MKHPPPPIPVTQTLLTSMGQHVQLAAAVLLVFLLTARWYSDDLRELVEDGPRVGHLLLQTVYGLVWRPSVDVRAGDYGVGYPLAANLSACHPSFTDANRPTNCCPLRRDADQRVIDFELPKLVQSPLRVRRAAHLLNNEYIAKYQRAANNHCLYCTGSYDQVNSSFLFKIHRSWLFFPWHRAFLFFHERILGKLIGDDTFALPYWNWDNPDGMVMPEFVNEGALNNEQRDYTHLPSNVADLNYHVGEIRRQPEQQVAVNLAFMYHQMVSGAKKPDLFLGCKLTAGPEGACNGPGTIEGAPHNTLHTWVGSGLNPERENMGAFYSAARDPIFYPHHANIDRLWEVWRKLRESAVPDFTESAWLDSSFTFYDENLRFVRIKVRDCLDIAKLGMPTKTSIYRGSRPDQSRLKKQWTGFSRRLILSERPRFFGNQERALESTVRVKLHRSRRSRSQAEKADEEEALVVYGIRVKGDTYAKFDVFVNLVADEETTGPLAREFAGTFVNMPRGARRVPPESSQSDVLMKKTLKLGISELLEDLEADQDDTVWVSLVPRGGTGVNITVEGVRIEFVR
ncbi:unnamed protein product [Spirodela intermedia]|uniref:Tyrosinase copper-binding domain-containing protein n=1 Tax=Spirodela intermedia TaxID=51605 RepID=A0A7I8ITM0_SPIIN|nr:unnamed protein product [Spirodela intermedia]CAA6661363.1 unnamed protein product [Spirodela intermedia]